MAENEGRDEDYRGALQSGVGLCYQVAGIWREYGGCEDAPSALVLHEVVMHLRRVGSHLEKQGEPREAERVGAFATKLSALVNELLESDFPV